MSIRWLEQKLRFASTLFKTSDKLRNDIEIINVIRIYVACLISNLICEDGLMTPPRLLISGSVRGHLVRKMLFRYTLFSSFSFKHHCHLFTSALAHTHRERDTVCCGHWRQLVPAGFKAAVIRL